jgi:exonuclease III
LFRPETRQAYKDLVDQGWTDAIRTLYPTERIYTFGDFLREAYGRNAGLRLDHFLLNKKVAKRLTSATLINTSAAGKASATMRQSGSNWLTTTCLKRKK